MEFKKTKMRTIVLGLLFIVFYMNLYAQNENISNINDVKYNFKLIKFYIEKNEYDNALEYIDKTLEESVEKDSLFFLKGLIYQEYKDWQKASEFYAQSILHTSEKQIINERLEIFKNAIFHVSSLTAFDIVSASISKAIDLQKHTGFLYILAMLYEYNQLYGEANDVYGTLLLETEDSESWNLKIKITTNKIFQKDYEEALDILEPLITIGDSLYNEKLLFLNYIANISIERYEDAKTSLLRLYLDFPENPNRKDIIAGLADVFEHQEQLLMSWYMLNELFMISDEVQKFKLRKDIDRIKQKICETNTIEDQFRYFKPIFELKEQNDIFDKIE